MAAEAIRAALDGLRRTQQALGMSLDAPPSLERLREALAGRYHVVCELGRGGMAVVYLAIETSLQRPVALKLLPPSLGADPAKRERFLREARTAARLRHPNIAPIHAVERAGEFVYFTMGYVEGVTLGQRVREHGPLPVGEATRLLHDVARAVGYAHRRGVVHRDLKPDNIMIEEGSGRAMVMDFGIAQVDALKEQDRPGYVLGTAAYMSPEQGQGREEDERTDVYALGITAYYAVTGHLPFQGETAKEILVQHAMTPAPALTLYGEHQDLTYSRAVARCLEKNPDLRFSDGEALADELARAPELRRRGLPLPLQAFVEGIRRHSAANRSVSVLVGVAVYVLATSLWGRDWTVAAGALGFLGVVTAGTAKALWPITRRVLREGYDHAHIVHALSVDLERERQVREFERGKASPPPSSLARRVAYAGLGVMGLGTALSLVEGFNPVVGFGVFVYGVGVTLCASGIGAVLTWLHRNVAGEWWLKFWQSRAGEWAVRVAGLGLEPRPVARALPPETAVPGAPPEKDIATTEAGRIADWVGARHTFETHERE